MKLIFGLALIGVVLLELSFLSQWVLTMCTTIGILLVCSHANKQQ